MGVPAIWRYPVKAMLGQRLDAVELGADGRRAIARSSSSTRPRARTSRASAATPTRGCAPAVPSCGTGSWW
jgi:uncharacterized protein YcbX